MRRMTLTILLLAAGLLPAQAQLAGPTGPQAGTWKTWVIPPAAQLRVPPPPDAAASAKELEQLAEIAATRDKASLDRVAYWDTGAPSYRWSEIAVAEHLNKGDNWLPAVRSLSLMHIAIYDAMVAAWDSK